MQRSLADADPEIADAIRNETRRQADGLELIASENFVSTAVLEAPRYDTRVSSWLRIFVKSANGSDVDEIGRLAPEIESTASWLPGMCEALKLAGSRTSMNRASPVSRCLAAVSVSTSGMSILTR